MTDTDPACEFLRQRGCADHVVRGGLEGLVAGWEKSVAYMLAGKPQFLCEYLNDLDGRQILYETQKFASPAQWAAITARLQLADESFWRGTVSVEKCLWGDENEKADGLSAAINWWYYRKPKHYEFPW